MLMFAGFQCHASEVSEIAGKIDLSAVQQAADSLDSGVDVRSTVMDIVSGNTRLDGKGLAELLAGIRAPVVDRFISAAGVMLGPMLVSALFARLFPVNRHAGELIFGCAGAAAAAPLLLDAMETASRLTEGIADVTEATVPILTSLSAMGGGTASAALITPAATLIGQVMVSVIGNWGVGIAGAAAVCACAGCIGSSFRLEGLFAFLRRIVQTGSGLMLAAFAGILKVQGMLGASFDSAAVKTARFAVDKLVPAVGGGIADTMDAALSSFGLIRSAVGVTGMLVTVVSCALPVGRICAALAGMRLARAIAQPIADAPLINAADCFADVLRMLVILCAVSLTLSLVLTGAAIGAGSSLSG